MVKNTKLILVVSLSIVVFIGFQSVHYIPMVVERSSLKTTMDNTKTHIYDSQFNFSFDIASKCHIKSEKFGTLLVSNHWSGKLICDEMPGYLKLGIREMPTEYETSEEYWGFKVKSYKDMKRVYIEDSGKYLFLLIKSPSDNRVFTVLGGMSENPTWRGVIDTFNSR